MKEVGPIFAKFDDALSSLSSDATDLQLNDYRIPAVDPKFGLLIHKFYLSAWAAIKNGQRFYVPNSHNVMEDREYDEDTKTLLRLPFDPTVLITESYIRETQEPTWVISAAFTADGSINNAFRIMSKDVVAGDGWGPGYTYGLLTLIKFPSHKRWTLLPGVGVCHIPYQGRGVYCGGKPLPGLQLPPELDIANEVVDDVHAINNLCLLLALNNVKKEAREVPEKLNRTRMKYSKLPLYSYYVLNVDGECWDASNKPFSAANSDHFFRSHFRRGHIRRLDENRRVWVKQCFVKGRIPGFSDKDYNVVTGMRTDSPVHKENDVHAAL